MAAEPRLILNWHAHVYFDAEQADQARRLCEAMRDDLQVAMGRVHAQPIGPHPRGSCQMTVPRGLIGEALEWLFRHRGTFTVFVHGNSGDDWTDHTRNVIWLGDAERLRIDLFRPHAQTSG